MDAGVAPADVRPGWLSHRDVSHSWLAGLVLILFLVCTTSVKYVAIALVCLLIMTTSVRIAALHQYARAVETVGGEGSRRAGLEALLNLAATAEGSSFLLSGHSINLAHLQLSLMDRDFHASDYDMLSALDEGAPARPRRCLSEAALKSIPSHIHPERPPLGVARSHSGAGAPHPAGTVAMGPLGRGSGAPVLAAAPAALAPVSALKAPVSALKKDRSKDGSRTVCSVCLENYVAGDKVKTLPFCRHTYHSGCITPWLHQQGLDAFCPLCKSAVFSQTA